MQPILDTLEHLYLTHEDAVEAWLAEQRTMAPPLVTTSVDLRHSGGRLAPVDTNLYPAGFQLLSPRAAARAGRFFTRWVEEHFPAARHILIYPEAHTRNVPYQENLQALLGIVLASGRSAAIHTPEAPLEADLIILNNDCTSGIPPALAATAIPVVPPARLGWHARRKSTHFAAYRALAEDFAAHFGLDPWLLAADFHRCGEVDFKQQQGLECVAEAVEDILARARKKHAEYGIAEAPYVFIKADSGTYGMGIMTVRSGAELSELNKKTRNKMNVIKEGAQVSEVIVQEGIPTVDTVAGAPAEPMIYLIDGVPVGGMWRVNETRDAHGNLNASGMRFSGMCDEAEIDAGREPLPACRFRPFGLIAALAALAAGKEAAA